MLTGVIQPLSKTVSLNRSDKEYPLWEQHPKPHVAELPWLTAAAFDEGRVRDLIATARTVVIGGTRSLLYTQVLASLRPATRVYAYGSMGMEADRGLQQALAKASDRVAVRLGYELPADWIVVDGGSAGVLFVGPPGEERRWAIPLEPALARTLFEAFRVLFWFHSRREGLPDSSRNFAFRPPLPSPYRDPGKDVSLPAGRLVIEGPLLDLVPDAEFRVVPDGSRTSVAKAGRTATLICPPDSVFDAARQLASGGTRVVWTETGLPQTTISRQRLVMDLVAAPVALQLEWGSGTAVDTFHRITKACEAPKWMFHAQRRLRDIGGLVLLEGAATPAAVKTDERIDLRDLRSPLATFEEAVPTDLPEPSPLAKNVVYAWRTVPEVVPAGAAKAQIVRQWTALDEWATGSVRALRQRLDLMEGEERGMLDRLRGFLRGQDAAQRERARIRDALAELGEQPPSQRSDAAEVARRLVEEEGRIRRVLQQAQADRQTAEDESEEAKQRKDWEGRVELATRALAQRRGELADLEDKEATADAAVRAAEAAILNTTRNLREARGVALAQTRDLDTSALSAAREKLEEIEKAHAGAASKELRRPVTQEIQRLEGAVAASKRELAALAAWAPASAELLAHNAAQKKAREAKDAIRKARIPIQEAMPQLERAAAEAFVFRAGARIPRAPSPEIGLAPPVPSEALPELGELFEHQGQRYLEVRTWEQAARALRVATRLRAELVAFPYSTK